MNKLNTLLAAAAALTPPPRDPKHREGTLEEATASATMASIVELLPPECQSDDHFLTYGENDEPVCICGAVVKMPEPFPNLFG